MRPAADWAILAYLAERVSASAPVIGAAGGLDPGEVWSRLAHLGSPRHVTDRQNVHAKPPCCVFLITMRVGRRIEV